MRSAQKSPPSMAFGSPYASPKASGKLLDPAASISVTGYSLGGHLATAFNLLRQADVSKGAGVGKRTCPFRTQRKKTIKSRAAVADHVSARPQKHPRFLSAPAHA